MTLLQWHHYMDYQGYVNQTQIHRDTPDQLICQKSNQRFDYKGIGVSSDIFSAHCQANQEQRLHQFTRLPMPLYLLAQMQILLGALAYMIRTR